MLNYIWFFMIILSLVCAAATGRLGDMSSAVFDGGKAAVELSVSMLGVMCTWLGFLKIAEKSGLTALLARLMSPAVNRLFPEYKNDSAIKGKICMNISANMLGIGNAATPLGLAAMEEMAKKNKTKKPTRGMILFVVMNTASLQLLPLNMAAVRESLGSAAPFSILPQVWLSSFGALALCVTACKLMEKSRRWS